VQDVKVTMPIDTASPTAVPAGAGPAGLAMPARRRRAKDERVQLSARVRVVVYEQLQRFVDDVDTTVQDTVDLALTEFLTARGYAPPAIGDEP
jgi:pyruvate/2-oxoglutarate dehydrogenase complex dihydrolipoamide acyltransferase (E2) component